jgi:hypothetical protein
MKKETKKSRKNNASSLSLWLELFHSSVPLKRNKTNPRTIAIRFSHKFTPSPSRCFFGPALFTFRYLT